MKTYFNFFLLSVLLWNCKSVEKYNAKVTKKHSPVELQEDVDFAYSSLKKFHPNLYQYINKETLEYNFETLKKSLTKPLSSLAFYKKIAPVIVSIRQGHTSISSPHKLQTKKERKKNGVCKNIFRTLKFNTLNGKVYIEKGYGKDSLISKGIELLKIEGNDVASLLKSYQNLTTGDGYNTTFVPDITRKNIGSFYNKTNRFKDSIQITLKNKDSVFTKYLYVFDKKKDINKKGKKLKIEKKKRTKTEKKLVKKKRKERLKWEYKHDYKKFTKEVVRDFKFIEKDDKKVAFLKITNFTDGGYKEFYDEVFNKIDSAKTENLVIDLRDNTGGSLREIAYFYSYMTDKPYQFINPSKMVKGRCWLYPRTHSRSSFVKSVSYLLFPVLKTIQLLKVKKIEGVPHYVFKSSKIQKPKGKHNYKGKIYVLINAVSFSASSVLSTNLKATKRAFFVGQETGGAYNSTVAGNFVYAILPNSKENLRIGIMNIDTPYKKTPDGFGVKPDKQISITTLDKDEQLNWVLKNIVN